MTGQGPQELKRDFSLFAEEEAAIAEGERMLVKLEEVAEGVRSLMRAYRRSDREQRRLVRLSDRVQDELRSLNARLEAEVKAREALAVQLELLAATDELTGAASRRRFMEVAGHYGLLWTRQRDPMSVVMVDLDHFKEINDQFGHAAGDQVLREFVDCVGDLLRESDLVGRLGGEEFAILLPGAGLDEAVMTAERLRAVVEMLRVDWNGSQVEVTASFGVAAFELPDDTLDQVLSRADRALYNAKSGGRNRIERAG